MTTTSTTPGLVARRVRLAQRDVVLLGGLLHGEDHLASIQGAERSDGRPTPAAVCDHAEPGESEGRVIVSVVTTCSRERELDAWLAELTEPLDLELIP